MPLIDLGLELACVRSDRLTRLHMHAGGKRTCPHPRGEARPLRTHTRYITAQNTAHAAHMRVTLPTHGRRLVGVCLSVVVAVFSASAALAILTSWRPRETAIRAAAATTEVRGGILRASSVLSSHHSTQHSTAGSAFVGSGWAHSFRAAAPGAPTPEEQDPRALHPGRRFWQPVEDQATVTAAELIKVREPRVTAHSVSWTGRAASGSIGSVRGHAWAHTSGGSAAQGSPQPVRMATMHVDPKASETMAATWQLRRLQQGAGAGGDGASVTVVATAQQLQGAVGRGEPHIEIRQHLDLSELTPVEPGGAAAAAGFESLALGVLPASVKSIRVRTPSMTSMRCILRCISFHSMHSVHGMQTAVCMIFPARPVCCPWPGMHSTVDDCQDSQDP